MEKDQNDAVKRFLSEFDNKGEQNPFEENTDNPFEHLDTKEETSETAREEKSLPFNQDPKVQKYLNKELNKLRDELTQQIQPPKAEVPKNEDTASVVDAFSAIIGNDTPEKVAALRALEKALDNADQRASTKAVEHLDSLRQQEALAERQAEAELAEAFDSIEDTFGVDLMSDTATARKTRAEFVTYVERIAPKDRNGNIADYPDMTAAWETFAEIRKGQQQPSRAKDLASRGVSRSSDAQVTGPQKRVTFDDAEAYIESLR